MNISPLEWLKAVPTSLAGTRYEPWVQMLQFFLVLAVFGSAIAWLLTRGHVIAVAQQIWSLLEQANSALEHACLYAPGTERRRKQQAPYVLLVVNGFMATIFACCALFFGFCLSVGLLRMTWSDSLVVMGLLLGATYFSRIHFAAASWAWHSIKTGREFTWPWTQPRS